MSGRFSVEADPSRDLVRIKMSGFFSEEDIKAFLEARTRAHAALACGPNEHLTLNDLRGMKIQSQESVAAFQGLLAAPEYRSRRLAFVVGPSLARNQLMRAAANRDVRCFSDPVAAEAWLLEAADVERPLRWATA